MKPNNQVPINPLIAVAPATPKMGPPFLVHPFVAKPAPIVNSSALQPPIPAAAKIPPSTIGDSLLDKKQSPMSQCYLKLKSNDEKMIILVCSDGEIKCERDRVSESEILAEQCKHNNKINVDLSKHQAVLLFISKSRLTDLESMIKYKINLKTVNAILISHSNQQSFDLNEKYSLGIRNQLIAGLLNKLEKGTIDKFEDFSIYLDLYQFIYVDGMIPANIVSDNFLLSLMKSQFTIDQLIAHYFPNNLCVNLARYIKDDDTRLLIYDMITDNWLVNITSGNKRSFKEKKEECVKKLKQK